MATFWEKMQKVGVALSLAEEVEEQPNAEETVPSPVAPKIQTVAAAADPTLVATLDQSARKQLVDAMEASGASLVEELMDLLETLRESITDETALYKAAIKILGKKGNTVVAIRQDFDKCVGALEAKDREFESQLKAQFDKRVGSRSKIVSDCHEQISDKQAQIAQLQSEIATLGATAHETQAGIAEEQSKLELAQARFTLTYKTLRGEIEASCAKVAQYEGKA